MIKLFKEAAKIRRARGKDRTEVVKVAGREERKAEISAFAARKRKLSFIQKKW